MKFFWISLDIWNLKRFFIALVIVLSGTCLRDVFGASINFEPLIVEFYEGKEVDQKRIDVLLHHAARCNDFNLVFQLLKAGANPYFTDEKGYTAFNHAASNGLKALAIMTEEAFRDTQRAPDEQKWSSYGLNTPSGVYSSTLITYAAKVCSLALIQEMVRAGADVTIINSSGWTLLHCAAVMPERQEVLYELMQAFKSQGLDSMISALSTKIYETDYNGHKVVFREGLTASELSCARLQQDPECPKEFFDYLKILTP